MMVKNVFFALLVGAFLISGFAYANYADQPRKTDVGEDVVVDVDGVKMIKTVDEAWASRNGEISLLGVESVGQAHRRSKATKAARFDTLRYLTGEGKTWNDVQTGTPWSRVDFTAQLGHWHVADTMHQFKDIVTAFSGDSAWWCGDPTILDGGYADDWYQMLTSPVIYLPPAADSIYLTYMQWLRCEENLHAATYSWDGYNVRIDTSDFATDSFFEIKPYQHADDSSYYRPPKPFPPPGTYYGEWDSLWCWGYHGDVGGGFSDTTEHKWDKMYYDLRPFLGDSVRIRYTFASDGAYNTLDDRSLFGLVLDDIMVTSYSAGTPTVHFEETCEAAEMPHQMTPSIPGATGNYWWLATANPYAGIYYGACGDSFSGVYVSDMDNGLVIPPIARDDLDTNCAELFLRYYYRGNVDDPQGDVNVSDWAGNDYSKDGVLWDGISRLTTPSWYVYQPTNEAEWNEMSSPNMTTLTPLIADTTWDTLYVRILFHSDSDAPGPQATSFKVDNAAIIQRIGFPWDIGVTAAKLPGPNANDEQLYMTEVAIENFGFNTAQSGKYFLKMAIVDSNGTVIWGPTQIADPAAPPPDIPALETRVIPLDPTVANFTLTQEGSYDFYIWAEFTDTTDGDPFNDTLKVEWELTKSQTQVAYPGVYNYPAGQGQIRYHDQRFYTTPSVWRILMDEGEVAAVHFDPPDKYDPFDVALAFWPFYHDEVSRTYNFHVYDSGSLPGAVLHTEQFTTAGGDSIGTVRIDLNTVAALQNRSTDFWLGVEFPPGGDDLGMTSEPYDPDSAAYWGQSYMWNDTSGTGDWAWELTEWDWFLTAVIRWKLSPFNPRAFKAGSDLYLEWDNAPHPSQSDSFAVVRDTDPSGEFFIIGASGDTTYTDPGAVGDVNTNYYYQVHHQHQDGSAYDKGSAVVGEFDRAATTK